MEQTVNLFTKGLQMDTNPMIQGSDTLTDALNATLVTMNGNEVILQNDMGNRRVDNAFLPTGYEPVGMKEYGGVIYVASYNPVTHRSQIGSFPSPERKITSIDDSNSTEITYEFSFPYYLNSNLDSYYCLSSDVILYPIKENLVLHAGDKFVIYSSDLSSTSSNTIKTKLSNYYNTDEGKITSPKNKLYTLSLGILNSQNEFVDITKDLIRWNEDTPISYNNESDLFKFNDGYFIANSYVHQLNNTINDNKLILERLAIIANTYSYKLCGPLYLKIYLNRPVRFNYNIYGYKEKTITTNSYQVTKFHVIFDCFITYNCPDGVNNETNSDDGIYKYTGIGRSLTDYIKFCDINKGSESVNSFKTTTAIYDKESNLYTINLRYEDTIDFSSTTPHILDYIILVKSGLNETINELNKSLYLADLSTKVSVNLDLLGSNTINLIGWRFYNNYEKQNTILTYSFEAYPRFNERFTNLTLYFYEYNGTSFETEESVKLENLNLNNGRNTISFDWEEKGFKRRKLYKVTYTYQIEDNNGNLIGINYTQAEVDTYNAQLTGAISTSTILTEEQLNTLNRILNNNTYSVGLSPSDSDAKLYNAELEGSISTDTIKEEDYYTNDSSDIRFFLTTELFNEHYSSSADDFWPDFFKSKRTFEIHIGIDSSLKDNSPQEEISYDGELSGTSLIITYNCKHSKTLSIFDSSIYKIIDEELYPDFITLKPGIYPKIKNAFIKKIGNTIITTDNDLTEVFNTYIKPLIVKNGTIDSNLENDNFSNFIIENSDKYITGTIEYYDRFISNGKSVDSIKNGFCPISKVASTIFSVQNPKSSGTGCGLSVDYHAQSGHGDDHFLNLLSGVIPDNIDDTNEIETSYFRHETSGGGHHNGQTPLNAITIDLLHGDSLRTFYLPNYITKVSNAFSHDLPNYQTITYMFGDDAERYTDSTNVADHSLAISARNAARVWFRTRNNGWALFKDLYYPTNYVKKYEESSYILTNNDITKSGLATVIQNTLTITINFSGTNYKIKNVSGVNISYFTKNSLNLMFPHPFNNFTLDFTSNSYALEITMNNFPKNLIGVGLYEFKDFIIEIEKNKIIFETGTTGDIVNNLSTGKLNISSITPMGSGISLSGGDFKFHKESISSNELDVTINQFVLNHLEHDYIYCAYDLYLYDGNNPQLYKSDLLNSTYNEKYSIPVTIGVQYEKELSNINEPPVTDPKSFEPHTYSEESIILLNSTIQVSPTLSLNNELLTASSSPSYIVKNYDIDKIEFKEKEVNTNEINSAIQIILSSGDEFYDRIYLDILLLNVDISTGKLYDSNNNMLDINCMYYYDEGGKLVKLNFNYLKVDKLNKINSINQLVYDAETSGMAQPRYNAVGWLNGSNSDASTLLDFSGINIITTI